MEILLLHPGGLGDIILALPAMALLRERFPSAQITLAANLDHVAPVTGTFIDRAVSLAALPLHCLYSGAEFKESDVLFWKSFEYVFSWTGWGDAEFVRRMTEANPAARGARWKPGPQEQRHVAQIFVDSLGPEIACGVKAVFRPILPGSELADRGAAWLSERQWNGEEPLAALHPGAGSKAKRWPIDRFTSLARLLCRDGKKLLIVEGPAEAGLAAMVARALPGGKSIIASSLPLDLLAAVMGKSEVFIGNDSGIAHLAAALRVPSVVAFGPTLPHHWAPLGPKVKVLRDPAGPLENITVEQMHCAVERLIRVNS